MTVPTGGATASGAAVAAAIAQAIKASGAIIKMDPAEFDKILWTEEKPIVVTASGGVFSKHYKYLTNHRGFFFYTKTNKPIRLDSKVDVIAAKDIWIP